jgi:hypothetical protein
MPRNRPSITMAPEEEQIFLGRSSEAVVAACNIDGWPVGGLARAAWQGLSVTLELEAADPVVEVASPGDPVCCISEESPSYYEIKGVIAHGVVASAHVRRDGPSRLDVDVERTVSFDFGRLPRPPA